MYFAQWFRPTMVQMTRKVWYAAWVNISVNNCVQNFQNSKIGISKFGFLWILLLQLPYIKDWLCNYSSLMYRTGAVLFKYHSLENATFQHNFFQGIHTSLSGSAIIQSLMMAQPSDADTDWNTCCICQEDTGAELMNPQNTGCTSKDLLGKFGNLLTLYDEHNCLPIGLNLKRLNDGMGGGLEGSLNRHPVKYHKACRNKFSLTKLEKAKNAKKKRRSVEELKNVSPVKKLRNKPSYTPPPPNTLTNAMAQNLDSGMCTDISDNKESNCFFCHKNIQQNDPERRCATTSIISANVEHWASVLNDTELKTKLVLNRSDLHAADAVYHLGCYTKLRSRYRSYIRQRDKHHGCSTEGDPQTIGMAAVVSYLSNCRETTTRSLFELNELFDIFVKHATDAENQAENTSTGTDKTSQRSLRTALSLKDTNLVEDDLYETHEDTEPFKPLSAESVPRFKYNRTRFKEQLLNEVPELFESVTSTRRVILAFDEDVGNELQAAYANERTYTEEEKEVLKRAAQILRRDSLKPPPPFTGSFQPGCEDAAIPQCLLQFFTHLLEGQSGKQSIINPCKSRHRAAISLCQLVQFNSLKYSYISDSSRHCTDRETPLSLYIAMKLYQSTRSKKLVREFNELGLCISYDRLISILNTIETTALETYANEDIVFPLTLPRGVFITVQADNLDSKAVDFHGTGISVASHTTHDKPGIKTDFPTLNHSGTKHALPDTFAVVKPAYLAKDDPTIPKLGDKEDLQPQTTSLLAAAQTKERIWLETCEKTIFKGTLPASGEVSSHPLAITYDYTYRFCLKAIKY